MRPKETFISIAEESTFTPSWRNLREEVRNACEACWNFLNIEGNSNSINQSISGAILDSLYLWLIELKEKYEREMPIGVGAAVLFRRYFLQFVALTLPESGIHSPKEWDEAERAVALSDNVESALNIIFRDVDATKEVVKNCRPEWNISTETPLKIILDYIENSDEKRISRLIQSLRPKPKRTSARPLAESSHLIVPADRINKATIEALTYGAMRQISPEQLENLGINTTFWRGHTFGVSRTARNRDKVVGMVGFRREPEEHVWRFLLKHGALAIKAQYALWARAYAETDAKPGVYISLTISQFCDDVGFIRRKRAHSSKSKRAALAVLELLTEMELVCIYQPPNGAAQRIRGPIWARGLISEELQDHRDIFHSSKDIKDRLWIPKAFSYAPGPFFENKIWRAYNHFIALVGKGLLQLRSDNSDKYAVMVGGYLAILARMNGYRKFTINVRTLLEKTGLWAVDGKKNPGRMRKKLEDALDRLQEVNVIKCWEITLSKSDIDADDLDNVATLEQLSEPNRWTADWFPQTVIVDWPTAIKRRESILKEEKERHLKKATLRRGKKSPTFSQS